MIVKTGGFMTFPTDPEEFVELVSEGDLNTDQLIQILDSHDHNTNSCEVCEYLYEDLGEGSYLTEFLVNSNSESITSEFIDRCIKHLTDNFAWNNGGYEESVAVELSTNPKSSAESLKSGATFFFWREGIQIRYDGESYDEDDFISNLKHVASHPLSTEEIFKDWLTSGHDPRAEIDHEDHKGSVDECQTCQGYFNKIWKK
jgi:hypothetical protein